MIPLKFATQDSIVGVLIIITTLRIYSQIIIVYESIKTKTTNKNVKIQFQFNNRLLD
jgi:hypothetical protein